MQAPPFRYQFLAPGYWPVWLGLGVLRLLCLLPFPWIVALGAGLGWIVGRVARSRREVVRVNLALCFKELDPVQRESLVDDHFKSLGVGLFEAGLAWWASDARLRRRVEVKGLEHLDAAMAGGTGVLLLTGHFTTLELGARLVAMQRPFHPMYRPLNNPLVDFLTSRWRSARAGVPAIPKDDLRGLVRALREGRAIWYAPDQTLDRRQSVWAPFFGVPTLTITACSRLARLGRARVVPYFPERTGSRYRLTFLPALENFPGDDETKDTARVNRLIEDGVRRVPAQYFWVHKRFKARPPGEPDVYARG